jgi:hypothetical protein
MINVSLFATIGVVATTLISAWAAFRYVVLGTYKLNGDVSKRIIDHINKTEAWTWILARDHVNDPKYPDLYEAIVYMDGIPFFLSKTEKLLTAGWKSKEDISTISYFRWHRKRIEKILQCEENANQVTITAIGPGHTDRLGELETDKDCQVYLDDSLYNDIEEDVKEVLAGNKKKTGMLLYGPPGNGKTQFVKYLSKKYALPINVVYLNPDYSNYDIARMFAEVPRRCIVLMEDFDNYFDGRECIMKNDKVNFTFDSFINALDGVHNDYRGVVFVMTANDITKIDGSLKSRPSRLRFVREFGPPTESVRMKILGDLEKVAATEGMSLDNVFAAK